MKKQIAAMMLGLVLHSPSVAGLAEGAAAYNEHRYAAALKEITPLATAGNAEAQHLLGLMYYMGRGVPRDYATAFAWHHKAAVQGVPAAQYVVGAMYYTGNGVSQDQALAVSWFRKAAEQGHPDAQYALGLMVRYHVAGLPEDPVIAYMLWNLAAASGHRSAAEQRAELARRMTEKQVAEAQCLSRHWQPGMPLPVRSHSGSSSNNGGSTS
jgi:TPR repeat protein